VEGWTERTTIDGKILMGTMMKVHFHSRDFASIESAGLGFQNRRPGSQAWQYRGRVRHQNWEGTYECNWQEVNSASLLYWVVQGDARLFGLAAALKSRGLEVEVTQN
jgi:hypothetical protein